MSDNTTQYIDTVKYSDVSKKITDVVSTMDGWFGRNTAARKLRYAELDVDAERAAGNLAPDEVYVAQHIIESNVRREQASYIQYLTQSNRAVILQYLDDPTKDCSVLERDLTNKLRYNDWQLNMFPNIDGMQQNGYSAMETVFKESLPGNIGFETVRLGDLGFSVDTKSLQEAEFVIRNYYFSKTQLKEMSAPDSIWEFDPIQTKKVIDTEPGATNDGTTTTSERSLYKLQKVMFRVKGVVHVGWTCCGKVEEWLRAPRKLFIGRKVKTVVAASVMVMPVGGMVQPPEEQVVWNDEFETEYPYTIFPYCISEDDTIDKLRGRAFLDQETQIAVTSLMSSVVTAYRRASGLYFSKDESDPNSTGLQDKNVYFKTGALIDAKIKTFNLDYPDPSALGAIQALVTANQSETSKVNFAAQNRKDSRKTATEIDAASRESASLSTVQVVLFSSSLKKMYEGAFSVIQSRVAAGLIEVSPVLKEMYVGRFSIRPSGDVDVIERQQMLNMMGQAWEIVSQTAAAPLFLADWLTKMFPDSASRYIKVIMEAQQQQNSQQAMAQKEMLGQAVGIGKQIIELSKRPEMFSETGKIHVLPVMQQVGQQLSSIIGKEQVG